MTYTRRLSLPAVLALATTLALTACGSNSGGTASSTAANNQGTPTRGGTLTMLGVGDLDHVDSADWYYSTDDQLANLIARQLLTYPRDVKAGKFGTTPVGDAASVPVVTNGGKTYTFHLKPGVKWDTSPARQVTADDFIRGIARTCNPVQPFGASSYFTSTIVGFDTFCSNELKIGTTAAALRNYLQAHTKDVTGMQSSDNGLTLTFHLIKPANDFENILALAAASAVPVEYLQYAPDSAQLGQHLVSDGPYKIDSYIRGKSIRLSRNPAWDPATDPNRPSYVDNINVTENLTQTAVQQQIQAGAADMEWDTFPLPTQVPQLAQTHDPGLVISPTSSSNPYIVFNTVSPTANHALSKLAVRQAISYAVNKANLLQVMGGSLLNNPLNQVLPTTINGGQQQFNDYPYNPAKAKQMLAAAGYPNGLTLKLLYRNVSDASSKVAQTLQNDLPKVGIHVQLLPVNNQDFYGKYMQVPPSITKKGLWDLGIAGWSADWTGNSARTYFLPLFDGRQFAPSSSNFGDFNDPRINALNDRAMSAPTPAQAAVIWHQDDEQVMRDAPFIPLTNQKEASYYNAKRVHGFIYFDYFQNGDPTNVWLTK